MKKLIILSDYGLDDAVAGAYLLGTKNAFEKIFIVAVAGNVSAEVSLNNARKLLDASGADESRVTLVRTDEKEQKFAVLPEVHGGDGMGDLITESGNFPYIEFPEFLSALSGSGKDYVVLSLGPLTVTETLMKKLPEAELVIMAGVVGEKPNFHGMEFNQALDPQAYKNCLLYPHVIATLDTCRDAAFNLAGHRFAETSLIKKLINRAVALAEARHGDNAFIYDFIASLYLTHENIFSVVPASDEWGNRLGELKLKSGALKLADFVAEL